MKRQFWSGLLHRFDRSLSSAKALQLCWLVAFFAIGVLVFGLVNLLLRCVGLSLEPLHLFQLIIDPGAFREVDSWVQYLFEFFILIFGAAIFTGALISLISSFLDARVEAYRKGMVKYDFSGHILILGSGRMLPNMIRYFASGAAGGVHGAGFADTASAPLSGSCSCNAVGKQKPREIVVLANRDIDGLRSFLISELDNELLQHVTLLFGNRNSMEELHRVKAAAASRIYILGEEDEPQHDSVSVASYLKLQKLCVAAPAAIKCFLVINNLTSFHVFQFQKQLGEKDGPLDLTIVNALENWAQKVLVTRSYVQPGTDRKIIYPSIDNTGTLTAPAGIGAASEKRVHFVVVGMTQMALVMANTVAHIAHYPNFKEGVGRTRTKITFICENIRQEMNFYKGHYSSLFQLAHSTYIGWDAQGHRFCEHQTPDSRFGDFLDTEWEFVDGGIETPQVRALLEEWLDTGNPESCNDLFTIAVCGKDSTANAATALYLPDAVFLRQIPVFVYQPLMGEILEQAHGTDRYRNIYPFGMSQGGYDFSFGNRLEMARRINDIYGIVYDQLNYGGKPYTCMHAPQVRSGKWKKLIFAKKLSNIYAANSIPGKFHSIGKMDLPGNPCHFLPDEITPEQIPVLARVEHNRWNMEKLLVGYHAISAADLERVQDEDELKGKYFTHPEIRPYDHLTDKMKQFDLEAARTLFDVVTDLD